MGCGCEKRLKKSLVLVGYDKVFEGWYNPKTLHHISDLDVLNHHTRVGLEVAARTAAVKAKELVGK